MRFHVISLPHTQTTRAFSSCAFTAKVINFCRMMKTEGHNVTLYAGEQNEAPCDELVPCISDTRRAQIVGTRHYTEADWQHPHWQGFNANVIGNMATRIQPRDIICVIGGRAHQPIADAFPNHLTVEFGVGYGGVFSRFRVFESYAWMHMHYGAATGGDPCRADGQWYDAVIPGYLDPADFPFKHDLYRDPARDDIPLGPKDMRFGGGYVYQDTRRPELPDYYLFVGRLIDRKGYAIAQDVCERLGKRLILAGPGEHKGYGEFVGVVGPEERGRLMAGAKALFAPTTYVEPFGNVAIEAMMCGTPVIATDWGAFTETVVPGVTGFRCRTLAEFCGAAQRAGELPPAAIRAHAEARYSLDVVGQQYDAYFRRLATLHGAGWYEGAPVRPAVAA